MRRFLIGTIIGGLVSCAGPAFAADAATAIAEAVSPLPESLRAGATVVTYDSAGNPQVLRQGTNAIVCQANQPAPPNAAPPAAGQPAPPAFAVSCYHKSMQPTRDLQAKLRAEGKSAKEVTDAVNGARKDGKLAPTTYGTMMYSRSGKSEAEARTIWVMFVPNATAESTGLPTERGAAGGPWLMAAGTPGAHVMMPQAPAPAATTTKQ